MTKDVLKFFHTLLKEMILVGGENLPKSISVEIGGKLSKLFKNRSISGVKNFWNQCIKVLNPR